MPETESSLLERLGNILFAAPPALVVLPTFLLVLAAAILVTGGTRSEIVRYIRDEIHSRAQIQAIRNEQRTDAIQEAVLKRDPQAVAARLRQDPTSIRARDVRGYSPIHLATWARPEIARMLLENGADIECQDFSGMTPLMLAARNGRDEMVDYLLSHGAKVRAEDFTRQTALHYAAKFEHLAAAEMLLEHGAPVNAIDARGYTPLDLARLWHRDVMIQVLYRYGGLRNGT